MRNPVSLRTSLLAVAACALIATGAQAAAVYSFTGTPITVNEPLSDPFAPLGSIIRGTVTFAAPLPASVTDYCLGPLCLTAQPTFWDIDIGITQRLRTDNVDFPPTFSSLVGPGSLSTDAAGNIVQWSMEFDVRNALGFVTQFAVLSSMSSHSISGTPVFDFAGIEFASGASVQWGSVAPGVWTAAATPIPIPSTGWLILLGLGGLGGLRSARAGRARASPISRDGESEKATRLA